MAGSRRRAWTATARSGPALQLACLTLVLRLQHAAATDFWSIKDIKNAMYAEQKYVGGCYKLLNRTGPVGCDGGNKRVSAMLIRLEDITAPLTEPRAVLVSNLDANQYLTQLLNNPSQRTNVVVVLVYNTSRLPPSDSAATSFPGGVDFTVYNTTTQPTSATYVWNPFGTGLGTSYLPLPVFRLSESLADEALWRARYNVQNDFKGAAQWAEAELTMEATQPTSLACLQAGTCLPLGGFSVWAAMPPLPVNTTTGQTQSSGLNTTLVVATIDSNAIFHDFVQAADAPLSGLIALLGAMRVISQANKTATYTRQLVFTALAGEVWNNMGSKRLLWELSRNGTSVYTQGLDINKIDQVIEVGMVGRASQLPAVNASRLFLHTQPQGQGWGDTTQVLSALTASASSTSEVSLNVSRASPSNPGIPPSPLHSFLRVKPSVAAVMIAEFDRQYINPYYQSSLDNGSQITQDPIIGTSLMLARTLHTLAAPQGAPALSVNITDLTLTVQNLVQCLVLDNPGMSCALATALLNPDFQVTDQLVSYAVKHYISVLQYVHPNVQDPFYKKTVYRFLWNYMGAQAAGPGVSNGQACAFQDNQCPPGYACIGWKGANKNDKQLMGTCLRSSVSYALSLSTALDVIPNAAGPSGLFLSNASAAWELQTGWPPDPIWTESNWPNTTPFLRVLQAESSSTEWAIFGSGIAACLISGVLSYMGKRAFEKHLKAS